MEDLDLEKESHRKSQKKTTSGTGVSPVHTFTVQRRCLPHWQHPGSIYFVTWRCRPGQSLSPAERDIALASLLHWQNSKWMVHAAVIMPDHVHALVQPLPSSEKDFYNLNQIIHSVKSSSVHAINQLRINKGSLWQDERFDRIVCNDAEFLEKYQYILNNPVKAGIVDTPENYPWLYVNKSA